MLSVVMSQTCKAGINIKESLAHVPAAGLPSELALVPQCASEAWGNCGGGLHLLLFHFQKRSRPAC